MHIGINAQLLSTGQNYRNGGISRYIRYLLNELAQQPGAHTYTVFVNGQDIINQLKQHPQINYVSAAWPEEKPTARILWEQVTLPKLIRKMGIEVLHSPANVRPEQLPSQCAGVVTLHDLAFLRYPEVLKPAKRLYHQIFTMRSLQRATFVITVSDSTRYDAHKLAHVPLERMQTVYTCLDQRFSPVRDEQALQNLRAKHQLEDGFLLYMGTLEPRKNILKLIEAYAILRDKYALREKLVLAGGKGWLYDSIFEKVGHLGLETHILFPGFIPDDEQTLWYQAASVLAYPSLYEGFGWPVTEALACGTPVVTSNISSLPEAGLDLALCVDPHDAQAIADGLYEALTNKAVCEKCQKQASAVKEKFSAQALVSQTINAYERAAELRVASRS